MATTNGHYANQAALVSTEWVAQHGSDPNVRLIEVDVDTSAYEGGHIRNAVGWNWQTQLSDRVRRDIPGKQEWEQLLSESGISNDTKIVFYGDNNNWFAAFAYWVSKIYGHKDAALMNGGRKKWELEGRELVKDVPQPQKAEYRASEPNWELRAFQPQVREAVDKGGKALVDVRSPAEFSGEVIAPPGMSETAQRAGHIPGAASVPWAQAANDDGTFKTREQLQALYAPKGVTPEKEVITYCRIGERSSHTWFVLKELLGYDKVRNYDGSWTEWGSIIGAPIENPTAAKA
ncbi:MAG TPA: sulfurtransferase [Chloroflexota bacterium]|nr:sulfurtransferase [Chloroflexota bacterium]